MSSVSIHVGLVYFARVKFSKYSDETGHTHIHTETEEILRNANTRLILTDLKSTVIGIAPCLLASIIPLMGLFLCIF